MVMTHTDILTQIQLGPSGADSGGRSDRELCYGVDALDMCHYTIDGVSKALLVAYPIHCVYQEARAWLRPLFDRNTEPADGWYEFRCELIEPNDLGISRLGALYPPCFYNFDPLPANIRGVRVITRTVMSQVHEHEFHPEAVIPQTCTGRCVIGKSHQGNFLEAYLDALAQMEILPGVGRALPRVRAMTFNETKSDSRVSSASNVSQQTSIAEQGSVLRFCVDPVSERIDVDVQISRLH